MKLPVRHVKCILSFRKDETKVKIQMVDFFHRKPDVHIRQLQVRMRISAINSPAACSQSLLWTQGVQTTEVVQIGGQIQKSNTTFLLTPMQVSQFILPPGQLAPGGKPTAVALPPGGKLSRDILPPTLVIFTPWGGKLSRPVYLAPRPTQVKIYTCYFVIFLYHFNEFRSSISHKVRNWCLWG